MNIPVPLSEHDRMKLDDLMGDSVSAITSLFPAADCDELALAIVHAVIHELGLRHAAIGKLTTTLTAHYISSGRG